MFEFAISQHRKRPPTPRLIFSLFLSCLAHGLLLLMLFLFPELLEPGRHLWFHPPILTTRVEDNTRWRTVLEIGKAGSMTGPTRETLKKYIYDWTKEKGQGVNPPIRVSWNKTGEGSEGESKEPAARARPVLGTSEPKPAPEVASVSNPLAAASSEGGIRSGDKATPGSPVEVVAGASAGDKKGTLYLPAPSQPAPNQPPKRGGEIASTSRSSAPGAVRPENRDSTSPSTPSQGPARVFENEQAAIRTEGSGLFDTKGFPLGDYANLVIERIKENWSIPSNLRNSQGRTTIIFYIEKSGQYTGLRIITTSGSDSLDLQALNAVLGSNPFPPLPKGFPGEHVGAKILFSYNERP